MKGDSLLEHIEKRQKELREDPLPYFRIRIQDMFCEDFRTLMEAYINCAITSPWTSEDTIYLFDYFIEKEPELIQKTILEEHDEFYHTDGTPFAPKEYVKWLQIITAYYKVIVRNPASFIGKGKLVHQDMTDTLLMELRWAF